MTITTAGWLKSGNISVAWLNQFKFKNWWQGREIGKTSTNPSIRPSWCQQYRLLVGDMWSVFLWQNTVGSLNQLSIILMPLHIWIVEGSQWKCYFIKALNDLSLQSKHNTGISHNINTCAGIMLRKTDILNKHTCILKGNRVSTII